MGALVYAGTIGMVAGVLLEFAVHDPWLTALWVLLSAALVLSRRAEGLLLSVFLCALALGALRTDLFLKEELSRNLSVFEGASETILLGTVRNDPERRESALHAHVEARSLNGREASGKILALLPRESEVFYGDTVLLRGRIERPREFETDAGRTFDYPGYLRTRGISALMRYATIEEREPAGFTVFGSLYAARHIFSQSVERVFSEPSASLLEGLLLGERRALPADLTAAFIAAGLIHIVVLSGYNISLVAEGVLRALSWLPRGAGLALAGSSMLLFVLMIGAGSTALRALIMALLAIVARYFGRPVLALRALAVAAAGMALYNPVLLLYDPSFILSVLATFGLITLSPSIERLLPPFARLNQLRAIAASTAAVQLFVLPALLYLTGVVSLWALPANIAALPLVPLAMALGFLAALAGLIHPLLSLPAALAAEVPLSLIATIAQGVDALPLSGATVATFPLWVAMLAYVPLTALALYLYKNAKEKECVRKKAAPVDVKVHG